MNHALAALLLLLPVAGAMADDAATPLDLSLPRTSLYAQDPPGTWYGDTSGVPASATPGTASRCPTAADGSPADLTGSATVGYGWSSRGGSGQHQSVALNYCRDTYDDEGDRRLVNIHVDVSQSDYDDGGRMPVHGGHVPPRGGHPPRAR